jgi:hypothetical protein
MYFNVTVLYISTTTMFTALYGEESICTVLLLHNHTYKVSFPPPPQLLGTATNKEPGNDNLDSFFSDNDDRNIKFLTPLHSLGGTHVLSPLPHK